MAEGMSSAGKKHRYDGVKAQMLIGGEWVGAASGETIPVLNPATEEMICEIASGAAADVDRAVMAARKAFESAPWRGMQPMQREKLLHRLADLMEANAEELAQLESLDNGKTLLSARTRDVPGAIHRVRYMAGWASKIEGRTMTPSINFPGAEFHAYVRKEPVGVVGAIIPWNFPLLMALGKLAPALAAGCTCVLKPAELTSLTALRMGELIMEAGFPAGVVNIVTGYGATAGAALVEHPEVNKIAFTGSTAVGRQIGARAMQGVKRVSLELGGKSPVIIGPGADIDAAVKGAAQAIFYNQGQVCIAGSRLYVQESLFDDFVGGVAEIAKGLKIGPGDKADTQIGPLVSETQMKRVLGYIDTGKAEGGKVLAGGGRSGDRGYFVEPTVFTGLDAGSKLMREEIFGPVVVASSYKSIDDIAAVANDTEYGLAASIWTSDLSFAHRLAARIRAGTVWVNCHSLLDPVMPFGGYKQSGVGRESGQNGVELYLETKTVLMKV